MFSISWLVGDESYVAGYGKQSLDSQDWSGFVRVRSPAGIGPLFEWLIEDASAQAFSSLTLEFFEPLAAESCGAAGIPGAPEFHCDLRSEFLINYPDFTIGFDGVVPGSELDEQLDPVKESIREVFRFGNPRTSTDEELWESGQWSAPPGT